MSESTLSAWSLSIHVPRGGGWGGDPFRSLCDLHIVVGMHTFYLYAYVHRTCVYIYIHPYVCVFV